MKSLCTAARAANLSPNSSTCWSLLRPLSRSNGARTLHTTACRCRRPDTRPGRAVIRRVLDDTVAKELQTELVNENSRASRKNFAIFAGLVDLRYKAMVRSQRRWTPEDEEYRAMGLYSQSDLDKCLAGFRKALTASLDNASRTLATTHQANPTFYNLRSGFIRENVKGLAIELKYAFQTYAFDQVTNSDQALEAHLAMTEMRYPHEWFPATRTMQRTIHLHVGPTNSGKTYNALKALENAKTGIYAGPLRLLAHEVFSRFTAKGKRCALITGEELRLPEGDAPYFKSCTVEMTPLNETVDVAVIDEIQMIADSSRGHAWTNAFFGVQAKELHLCGEARTVGLIEALCARIGDKCIVHRYERLNPLEVADKSLGGDLKKLERGDCVVSFSRLSLHALKSAIEKTTGRRCAIVYGALPPETRASQAALFNDPDNDYDFLVASDAIGMGLNLEIKRVIFETTYKRDDVSFRALTVAELKQIGGRAGRFRTAASEMRKSDADITNTLDMRPADSPSPGIVTSLENDDIPHIRKHLPQEPPQILAAGLEVPHFMLEKFARTMPPGTPLSFTILRLRELCRTSGRFFLCGLKETIEIAEAIQEFPLTVNDRSVLLTAPVTLRDPSQLIMLKAFASCIAGQRAGTILDNLDKEFGLEILDTARENFNQPMGSKHLVALESLHKSLTLYLWLSYRYAEVFVDQALAFHIKHLCEEKISHYLEEVTFVPELRARRLAQIRKAAEARAEKQKQLEEQLLPGDRPVPVDGEGVPTIGRHEADEEPFVEDEDEVESVEFEEGHDEESEGRNLSWNEEKAPEAGEPAPKEKSVPLDQLAQQQQERHEESETRTGA